MKTGPNFFPTGKDKKSRILKKHNLVELDRYTSSILDHLPRGNNQYYTYSRGSLDSFCNLTGEYDNSIARLLQPKVLGNGVIISLEQPTAQKVCALLQKPQ